MDILKFHIFFSSGSEQLADQGQRQRRTPGHRSLGNFEPDLQQPQERKTEVAQPRPEAGPLQKTGRTKRTQVRPCHPGLIFLNVRLSVFAVVLF